MKYFFPLILLLIMACSSTDSEVLRLQEQVKKDTIEKLELPEGTQFNNDSIIINKAEGTEEDIFELYAVTILVPSKDENGKNVEKTQVLLYQKINDEENKSSFQLLSFE